MALCHHGSGMEGCVFCGIVAGRLPASVMWRGNGETLEVTAKRIRYVL